MPVSNNEIILTRPFFTWLILQSDSNYFAFHYASAVLGGTTIALFIRQAWTKSVIVYSSQVWSQLWLFSFNILSSAAGCPQQLEHLRLVHLLSNLKTIHNEREVDTWYEKNCENGYMCEVIWWTGLFPHTFSAVFPYTVSFTCVKEAFRTLAQYGRNIAWHMWCPG